MRPPRSDSTDDRSSLVVAYQWASRVITVSTEMVVPGVLGYWLDRAISTTPAFAAIGFILGLILGIWHLLRMVNGKSQGTDGS